MQKKYLEAGRILGTHGVAGELRVEPWCDSAEFLKKFRRFFIDERETAVVSSRIHKNQLLLKLENVETVEQAMLFKGKIIFIDRADARLAPGARFVQDLLGLPVFDRRSNGVIGTLKEIRPMPASDLYVVELADGREAMIPAVPAFLKELRDEMIVVETIDGMLDA